MREKYVAECLRQVWDFAARGFILSTFGIFSDGPTIDRDVVTSEMGEPLAEIIFFDQCCHAGRPELRELCRSGILDEDFQILEKWLKPHRLTAPKAEKVMLLDGLFRSLLAVAISTAPVEKGSLVSVGSLPSFWPNSLEALICHY